MNVNHQKQKQILMTGRVVYARNVSQISPNCYNIRLQSFNQTVFPVIRTYHTGMVCGLPSKCLGLEIIEDRDISQE